MRLLCVRVWHSVRRARLLDHGRGVITLHRIVCVCAPLPQQLRNKSARVDAVLNVKLQKLEGRIATQLCLLHSSLLAAECSYILIEQDGLGWLNGFVVVVESVEAGLSTSSSRVSAVGIQRRKKGNLPFLQ